MKRERPSRGRVAAVPLEWAGARAGGHGGRGDGDGARLAVAARAGEMKAQITK